ncbi:hypothetical protein SESBI_16228 [Sesbania bispinosa]|nr:hypothetical protein SESBI_16228 [Sesbania bispinosa]
MKSKIKRQRTEKILSPADLERSQEEIWLLPAQEVAPAPSPMITKSKIVPKTVEGKNHKGKAKDPTPFVMPDWTRLYQKKMREATLKVAPSKQPYKRMKVLFDNLTEEDLEEDENLIVVPIELVEPSITSRELSQPFVDVKVEEVVSYKEHTKNKVDVDTPTDNIKGGLTEIDNTSYGKNDVIPAVINLEEPAELFDGRSN